VNSTSTSLPSKQQELLDFQARWMRPAGIAAIVAGALLVVAGIVGSVGSADTTAEQLDVYQDHSGRLLLASVLSGLGLLLVACPLYFLFRSARARAERMRPFVAPLILAGAVLVAAQGVVVSMGLKDASDAYVAGVGAVEANARQAPPTPQRSAEQRVTDARENFADDKVEDTSNVRIGRIIGLVGALTLIAGAVYTLIWSMRTGLLTRFMATVGIVFLAALLLIPAFGPIGTVLWFAVLGLMLAGWWIRPLPPAWDAGEAVPWPGRDDIGPAPGSDDAGTVEGSGREVSEQPLPEGGGEEEAQPQPGETQGQRRKKRKRRK
jgi:hypothetical protein